MSALTSPDNIVYWTTAPIDPASLVAESAAQATSIQNALLTRQGQYYRWTNAAARTAQTGMVYGSKGFQVDTGAEYLYDGANWKLWTKATTAFTPSLTNVTIGASGTNSAFYSVSAGICKVRGVITLSGAGLAMGTGPTATLPFSPVTIGGTGTAIATPIGSCTFNDAGSRIFLGSVLIVANTGNVAQFQVMSTAAVTNIVAGANPSATIPMTWAAGDQIQYEYSFEIA